MRHANTPPEDQLAGLDLWASLEQKLDAEGLDSRPAPAMGTVRSLDEARHKRRRSIGLTAVFSTLAAAAALLVLLRSTPASAIAAMSKSSKSPVRAPPSSPSPTSTAVKRRLSGSITKRPINGKPVKSARHSPSPRLLVRPLRQHPQAVGRAGALGRRRAAGPRADPSRLRTGQRPAAAVPAAAKAGSPDDAKETASCLVRTIHAVHEGSAFDAQLEPLKGQLKSPALSAWKSFKQIDKQDLTLPRHSPQSFNIPGEHRGSLPVLRRSKEGKQRLRPRLELFDGAAKLLSTVVLIDNGGTMLQAGTKHAGGTLILGFTCQLKKPLVPASPTARLACSRRETVARRPERGGAHLSVPGREDGRPPSGARSRFMDGNQLAFKRRIGSRIRREPPPSR